MTEQARQSETSQRNHVSHRRPAHQLARQVVPEKAKEAEAKIATSVEKGILRLLANRAADQERGRGRSLPNYFRTFTSTLL
jgi:hypothetical protein